MKTNIFILLVVLISSGCLRTRQDIQENEQKKQVQDQVSSIQRSNAEQINKYSELEENIRNLNGRIETLDSKLEQKQREKEELLKQNTENNAALEKKLALMQESLVKMEQELEQAKAREKELSEKKEAEAQAEKIAAQKDDLTAGEDYFEAKDWKKAILSYQKYREKNPKGKKFSEVTYKIGVCFQELSMKEEAKAFYEEVINKYPKSKFAEKSATRLKQVK